MIDIFVPRCSQKTSYLYPPQQILNYTHASLFLLLRNPLACILSHRSLSSNDTLTFEGCVVNMSLYLSKSDLDRIFVLAPSSFSIWHCTPRMVPSIVNKGWCGMSWVLWKVIFVHAFNFSNSTNSLLKISAVPPGHYSTFLTYHIYYSLV